MRYLHRAFMIVLGLGVASFSLRFLSQERALSPIDLLGFLLYFGIGCSFLWEGVWARRQSLMPASPALGRVYIALGGACGIMGIASLISLQRLETLAQLAAGISLVTALALISQGLERVRSRSKQAMT